MKTKSLFFIVAIMVIACTKPYKIVQTIQSGATENIVGTDTILRHYKTKVINKGNVLVMFDKDSVIYSSGKSEDAMFCKSPFTFHFAYLDEVEDAMMYPQYKDEWINDSIRVRIIYDIVQGFELTTIAIFRGDWEEDYIEKPWKEVISVVRGSYDFIDSVKCIEYNKAKLYSDSICTDGILKKQMLEEREDSISRLVKQLNKLKCK